MSLQSRLNSLVSAIGADIKSLSQSISTHKYHKFSNGQYFYDNYEQGNFLRLFFENSAYTTTRFSAVSNVEYWDGAAWVAWAGGDSGVKNLLDGRENTGLSVDHTHRKFRFNVTKTGGWPTLALVMLQSTWTGVAYPSMTVTLEDSADAVTWTLKDTAVFGAGTTASDWGVHLKAVSALHNGRTLQRVTIDINDWVDSGSYTTVPLRRFEILSNYDGRSLAPWSWNHSKTVAFEGDITSAGQAVVKTNDARLSDARTPTTHTHTKAQITDFAHTHPEYTSGGTALNVWRVGDVAPTLPLPAGSKWEIQLGSTTEVPSWVPIGSTIIRSPGWGV